MLRLLKKSIQLTICRQDTGMNCKNHTAKANEMFFISLYWIKYNVK